MAWVIFWRCMLDLVWLFFLLILFRHFWQDRQALVRAKSWLITQGRITSCEWTEVGHSIWPKIEYSYQVDDKDLTGEYLFLDTAHNNPNSKYSRSIAYKAAVAFKEDKEIDVYYNPNNPEQSALDVTVPTKLNIILILIGSFIILHLGLIAWRYLG
ncbi:Protein of uncharacterised function (DUF3592) [Legionella sainthelensi]|uniref:DUF3592 domain-containing protein n=1 Tax=Legionella sainthelensi TaxID=28087 RepID=A0A2H5FI11_9GAMM|nr:DUF3592 domain-containing protein [Legionella sainthelensi]AUH71188.1 DUF3592 domain-containing protein [Legionella sainthelensi]VEB39159.1 Protein of uncharacterised function (DUF3592) [Legionella sainthelensi]